MCVGEGVGVGVGVCVSVLFPFFLSFTLVWWLGLCILCVCRSRWMCYSTFIVFLVRMIIFCRVCVGVIECSFPV